MTAATRPIGVWLYIWGFKLPSSNSPTEGSIIDACWLTILIVIGIYILNSRHYRWHTIIRENIWFLLLFFFMALSIFWSQYPMVSFKRVITSFGSVVMALVVLTEPKPVEAIIATLRRCAYFTIPLSIITIKYFRNIGVQWGNWSGEASWVGLSMSKNTLGQVATTGALCFIWEKMRKHNSNDVRVIDFLYIIMSLYLLKGSDNAISATSISVFATGFLIFIMLNFMKIKTERIKPFFKLVCIIIFAIQLTLICHTLSPFPKDSALGFLVQGMGRDMTLTGRTEIWSDIFSVASHRPMLGTGYGAFWIGRLVNIPWSENMSWVLNQAHNGYFDIYLQLGWVGICLLIASIFFTIPKIVRTFSFDYEYGRFRMTFFLVILFINITESTLLRLNHQMWFIFLLAALTVAPYKDSSIVGVNEF